jgi:hypothetical protein
MVSAPGGIVTAKPPIAGGGPLLPMVPPAPGEPPFDVVPVLPPLVAPPEVVVPVLPPALAVAPPLLAPPLVTVVAPELPPLELAPPDVVAFAPAPPPAEHALMRSPNAPRQAGPRTSVFTSTSTSIEVVFEDGDTADRERSSACTKSTAVALAPQRRSPLRISIHGARSTRRKN